MVTTTHSKPVVKSISYQSNEDKVLVEEINKKPDLAIELRRSQAFQELEEELNNQ